MTDHNGTLMQWNSENLPVSISQDSGDASSFHYAPDRQRYYRSAEIAGVATFRHHLMAYGREVAEVDLTNSGGSVNETVSYMLTDHLGSVDDVHGCTSAARPWEIPEGGRKPEAANVEPIHMTGRVCDRLIG